MSALPLPDVQPRRFQRRSDLLRELLQRHTPLIPELQSLVVAYALWPSLVEFADALKTAVEPITRRGWLFGTRLQLYVDATVYRISYARFVARCLHLLDDVPAPRAYDVHYPPPPPSPSGSSRAVVEALLVGVLDVDATHELEIVKDSAGGGSASSNGEYVVFGASRDCGFNKSDESTTKYEYDSARSELYILSGADAATLAFHAPGFDATPVPPVSGVAAPASLDPPFYPVCRMHWCADAFWKFES